MHKSVLFITLHQTIIMKRILFFIFIILLFSCKKESKILHNNANYQKAKACRDSNVTDSAFYYYNLAKNDFLKASDSLGVGNCLVNMAVIQTNKGDYFGGIESSLEAKKFLKKQNDSAYRRALSTNNNNVGLSFHFLKDFKKSSSYYIETLKYIDSDEDRYLCYNNIGDLLISQEKLDSAKIYLERALPTKDSGTFSKVINNLSKVKYLMNRNYNPLPEFYKSLKIRELRNDGLGKNSSFETLSTYYLDKDKNLSLAFAKNMLYTAFENKLPDDQITALKRIITLDSKNYLQNFQKFDSINENLQITRSQHKNQFAVIRFDVEKLTKEGAEKSNSILKLSIGVAALIITLLFIIILYRKRQIRLKQEKELEVKNTQLKMSKKVHDVVANGLYHMMVDVQNNPEMDKTKILNNIEKMYEESRDISHEKIIEEDFSSRFVKMISSYSSPEQKVLTVGYNENIWENVSYNIQLELYYILREILVNMKKHSNAKLASLKFEKNNESLKIKYTDNGVGIDHLNQQKGAGIHNTENRIESIGGDITFEKNPAGGLIIQITIPIH